MTRSTAGKREAGARSTPAATRGAVRTRDAAGAIDPPPVAGDVSSVDVLCPGVRDVSSAIKRRRLEGGRAAAVTFEDDAPRGGLAPGQQLFETDMEALQSRFPGVKRRIGLEPFQLLEDRRQEPIGNCVPRRN